MRIIAGKARGRSIKAPRGSHTRPTSERVREALFSIIEARLELANISVLDLFAGSGALGLEALSRGAASLTSIDSHAHCTRLVRQNAVVVGFGDRCVAIQQTVTRALRQLQRRGQRYNLILADPPYEHDPLAVLRLVDELNLLERPGLVVIEHRHDRALDPLVGRLALQLTRRYGDSALSVFAPGDPATEGEPRTIRQE